MLLSSRKKSSETLSTPYCLLFKSYFRFSERLLNWNFPALLYSRSRRNRHMSQVGGNYGFALLGEV